MNSWTEQIRFSVLSDSPVGEHRWIKLRPPQGNCAIALANSDGKSEEVGKFYNAVFGVDQIEAVVQHLKGKGVRFVPDVTEEPWGKFAIFEDVDGKAFWMSEANNG